ncbi:hypothetical protein MMC16_000838 [Acarospora aff. strigata]|nr:hypothetical protein [Acarospora aff. strigata]
MFENFSFGPSTTQRSQYPPLNCDTPKGVRSDSISPTSSRSISPRRDHQYLRPSRIHLSVTELAHKLSAHSLQPRQPQPTYYVSPPTTPPADDDNDDDDDDVVSEHHSRPQSPPLPCVPSPGCRRRQRQIHTRLQCDPQHLKVLADLVEGMVSTGSQCYVYQARNLSSPSPCDAASPSPPHLTSSESSSESSFSEDGSIESYRSCRRNATSPGTPAHKQSLEWSRGRTSVLKNTKIRKDVSRRGSGQVRRPDR